jgi:hypothetical protein
MRMNRTLVVVLVATLGIAVAAIAGESVTLEGKVVCAKCTLKKTDAKECQNVLLVRDADGKDVEYYIANNDVATKFGEVCTDTRKVTVTGTLAEKDGRRWITASKMQEAKS